jgi:DNA polymerase
VADDAGLQACRRCDLWRHATQPVAGVGVADAALMLVGEQPGDEEDLRGQPFVGPAGTVLDRALAAADLDRRRVFLTNAVKHFKWEPRGKRRLHKRPGTAEIEACNVWLQREIAAVRPAVIVALGATALRALTGAAVSVEEARRHPMPHAGGARIVATYHPAAILRADAARAADLAALLEADLHEAAALAAAAVAAKAGAMAGVAGAVGADATVRSPGRGL